jgi:hypothetical protein
MREAMEIAVGAPVEGDEGFVGEVERIDLDPSGSFAVRLSVRPRHEGGKARLIPADELEPGPLGLRLHRTLKGFEELPLTEGSHG